MYTKIEWLEISHKLQSIAQAGLTFSENNYDLDRYEQLLEISKEIITKYSDIEMDRVSKIFDLEKGYITPKVDVRGVVFRGDKILMVRETIDGNWSLPGGWADIGLSPSEVVEKEVLEESGLKVKANQLIAVMDKKCHPHPPDLYSVYKLFFRCEELGGEMAGSIETSEVKFFGLDELPELSTPRNTRSQISKLFEVKDQSFNTLFD